MAGFTGGNITERSYGNRFGRAASKKAKNESKGENEHPTHRTKTSMKPASNLMQDALRLSVFHRGNTGEQFLRHAKGLRNLADEGASTPLEIDHNEFVRLNVSLIVTFNRARYRFVGCFKKHERRTKAAIARRAKNGFIGQSRSRLVLKTDGNARHPITDGENIKECGDKKLT